MRSRILLFTAALALLALQPAILSAERPVDPPDDSVLPAPWLTEADAPTFGGQADAPTFGVLTTEDDSEADPGYLPNRLLVRFEPGTTEERKRELHARFGGQVIGEVPALGVQVLKLYDDSLAMVSAYQANSDVTYAEPDYRVSIYQSGPMAPEPPGAARPAVTNPNDPLYTQQWHHETIDSPDAWDYATGDGVTIAIIDTGTNCDHSDLAGKCIDGYDFINNDAYPSDDHGHGTHVAGIAAAATNNNVGVAATGWDAAIMPVKALDATGNGGHSALANAITWATDNGADVINMSLGGFFTSSTLSRAIDYAISNDVAVFAASGNENTSNPSYPAAYAGVIAVAATTPSDTRASFSNYGNHIDVSAPGVAILSTVRQGGYQAWNGTSMATPVVAGVAALLLEQDPDRDPARIEEILEATAVDLGSPGWDQLYGAGRIDAGDALAYDNGGGAPRTPTATRPVPTAGPPTNTPTPSSDFVQQVEDLINLERADRDKPPLHTHQALRDAAARHSEDLAANVLCQHGGSDASTPGSRMRDAGYMDPYGEIVACGQASPASVVYAWMQSTPHRDLILCDGCTELGAGYSFSGNGFVHYWTVTFGTGSVAGAPTPTLASPSPPETNTPGPPTDTPTPPEPLPTSLPGSVDVVIDPTANRIGWVVSTEPNINHFDSADTYTGTWDNRVYHGAMQFDLTDIPVGAHVNFARLEIFGRSTQFLGTSGTWAFKLLHADIDANFQSHGYSNINSASIDASLLPPLGVVNLEAGQKNTFSLDEGPLAVLASRVDGSRQLSLRIDGPDSGSGSNLFTWDTGYTSESSYDGPKLHVNYSMTAPTAAPTETPTETPVPTETPEPTDTPAPTDTPEPPTEGPSPVPTDTPTPTDTPVPPTATDTPPPPPPTNTPTSTAVPSPDAPVEFVVESGDVGWVLQYEAGNHFGEESILAGYSDGRIYVGAMQFDISSIPEGSQIQEAQLFVTGQSRRNLASLGNGLWRVKLLQTEADAGWQSHSFPSLSSARVFTEMQPKLRQYDLDSGKRNVFVFDDVMLRELEWRAATTGKVSFKIDGPRTGSRNVFDWESGYGLDSQHPPVLAVVYGPPNGNEPQPTAIPEHEERVEAIVGLINEARVDEGLAPLTVNASLRRAAEIHNFDMTFHDFFSHTGSDGSSPSQRVARAGYDAVSVGEILAARSSDPESVMTAWMARAQRDLIMSDAYTEIGVDYTQYLGSSYNHYWTVVFAKPIQTP